MALCWPLKLPLVAKSVLVSLADNANDDGYCWPSIDTISERTCASRRAVIEAIKTLESYGVVTANRTDGRHTTYQLTPQSYAQPVQQAHPLSPINQCGTRTRAVGAPVQEVHKPVQEMHGGGAGDARGGCAKSTLTVIEPSINHQEPKERASRLSKNWVPSFEEIEFCKTRRPDLDPHDVAESFRDYWAALPDGPKAKKLDWPATWRTWVKRQDAPKGRASGETAYQRSMREKIESVAPLIAAKAPGQSRPVDLSVFDKPKLLENA